MKVQLTKICIFISSVKAMKGEAVLRGSNGEDPERIGARNGKTDIMIFHI